MGVTSQETHIEFKSVYGDTYIAKISKIELSIFRKDGYSVFYKIYVGRKKDAIIVSQDTYNEIEKYFKTIYEVKTIL